MSTSEESHRILLVEDEQSIRKTLQLNLELEGYVVVSAVNGAEALECFRNQRFDLAILDVMLPQVDGFTVCKTIRLEGNQTPILFLTAKHSGPERAEGLRIGADDYVTKPFHLEELLLRVRNLVQRKNSITPELETYSFGGNTLDFKTYKIIDREGNEKQMSKREMMLLKLLVQKKGQVVSREEILETVWGYDVYPSTRTIDNYILAFRKYFEPNPRQPIYFFSVRGVGYKFSP